jgi:hypothetical protein
MEVFLYTTVRESSEDSRSDTVLRRKRVKDVKLVTARDERTGRRSVDSEKESWSAEEDLLGRGMGRRG